MREHLETSTPELFSPFRIVEAIEECTTAASLEEGLRRERELFLACMDSPQRAGLIHLFFAARNPHVVPGVDNAEPFKSIALIGEHPLFDKWQQAAQRGELMLTRTPDANTELCLLAPGEDASACPSAMTVALQPLTESAPATPLSLVLAERGPFHELVNHSASASDQQRIALTLKVLRANVVVSKSHSVLSALYIAAQQASANDALSALEQASLTLAQQDACYRESDIDLLAVEALGYPRHLGGPHRQGTLQSNLSSTPSKDAHS
jgi:3-hydroxyacyl-CoA dehydrogenase